MRIMLIFHLIKLLLVIVNLEYQYKHIKNGIRVVFHFVISYYSQ